MKNPTKPIVSMTAILLQGIGTLLATDYYVSPSGNDTNSGSLASPLATIQKAVDLSAAGDSIYLRAGSYHESVNLTGKNGSPNMPINITNHNNEEVFLDGRIDVTSSWTQHAGNIYKTTLSEDIWQLWVDGEAQTLARWPNAKAWSEEFWDQSTAWAWTDTDDINHNGWVEDAALTAHTNSLVGCVMIMNSYNWKSRGSVVTAHTAGSDNFTFSPVLTDYNKNSTKPYFLTGLPVLDTSEEWFYDDTTSTLYLWADDGLSPDGRSVLGKNQSYFFNGGQDASYIIFDDLTFVGTTISMNSCENIKLLNCDFLYPVSSKRTLGSYADADHTDLKDCDYLEVINCTFQCSDGRPLVATSSDYVLIENNLFYQTDYACLAGGSTSYTLQIDGGIAPVYRRNEIIIAGASEGCRIDGDAYPNAALTEYNYHARTGLMQGDGASIQYPPGGSNDSINRYNWFIDLDNSGLRFDGNPGGEWGNVYRNVAALGGTRGFQIKGDLQEIYNNAGMDYTKEDISISKVKGPIAYNGEANHNSSVINNASNDSLTDNYATNVTTNWDAVNDPGTLRDEMRDPDNLDFRLKTGSALIDAGTVISGLTMEDSTVVTLDISSSYNGAAPDIGPYEHGDSDYFIPGRILPRASHPVPLTETTTAKIDCDLMWLQGENAVSHNIYFGTQSGNLGYKANQTNNIYTPSGVQEGVTYYWRVDTVTATDVITGDEWSFTPEVTIGDNRAPHFYEEDYISLSMTAVGSVISDSLVMDAFDPDSDVLTFSKTSGPAWINIATDGTITGTPSAADTGLNELVVRATDTSSAYDECTVKLYVTNWVNTVDGVVFGGDTGQLLLNAIGTSNIDITATTALDITQYGHGNEDWAMFAGTIATPSDLKSGGSALSNFQSPVTLVNFPKIKFSWTDGDPISTGAAVAKGIGNVYGSLGISSDPFTRFITFDLDVAPGNDYILRLWMTDQRVATAVTVWNNSSQNDSPDLSAEFSNDANDLRWHKITIQNVTEAKTLNFGLNIKNASNNSKHQLQALSGISLEAVPIP